MLCSCFVYACRRLSGTRNLRHSPTGFHHHRNQIRCRVNLIGIANKVDRDFAARGTARRKPRRPLDHVKGQPFLLRPRMSCQCRGIGTNIPATPHAVGSMTRLPIRFAHIKNFVDEMQQIGPTDWTSRFISKFDSWSYISSSSRLGFGRVISPGFHTLSAALLDADSIARIAATVGPPPLMTSSGVRSSW